MGFRRNAVIILIGHGYIGSVFAAEMQKRGLEHRHLSHRDLDGFWAAHELFNERKPSLVINCAAFVPQESVALCEQYPAETIAGNLIFPLTLAHACEDEGIPFAQISTGCLWGDGREHSEEDAPQRSFTGYGGFYIGVKVLAEQAVRKAPAHYIWRIRLPFDEFNCPRNYLRKLADFPQVWDHENSLSHRGDFVKACLDLWKARAPWGTYHVMNPGSVKAVTIVERLMKQGIRSTPCAVVQKNGGDTKVSVEKMLRIGVRLRPVDQALDEALANWK